MQIKQLKILSVTALFHLTVSTIQLLRHVTLLKTVRKHIEIMLRQLLTPLPSIHVMSVSKDTKKI